MVLRAFESLKTLWFEWIAVVGRIVNASDTKVLRLCQNVRREKIFGGIASHLSAYLCTD